MRTQGYNGTGVKDIVDAAGVPKGSFYNYFESKEAFAIAALEQIAEGNLMQMRRMLGDNNTSPLVRFVDFFNRNIDHLKRTNQLSGGCFIGTICQEIGGSNETIRIAGKRLLDEYEKVLADCLQLASEEKELSAGTDIPSLASFIFSAWEGALLKMKADKDPKVLDIFLVEIKKLLQQNAS